MAQLILTIPDDKITRIGDAFVSKFSFEDQSGMTKPQFVKKKLIDYIKQVVISQEGKSAANNAVQTIQVDVNSIGIN